MYSDNLLSIVHCQNIVWIWVISILKDSDCWSKVGGHDVSQLGQLLFASIQIYNIYSKIYNLCYLTITTTNIT